MQPRDWSFYNLVNTNEHGGFPANSSDFSEEIFLENCRALNVICEFQETFVIFQDIGNISGQAISWVDCVEYTSHSISSKKGIKKRPNTELFLVHIFTLFAQWNVFLKYFLVSFIYLFILYLTLIWVGGGRGGG